MAARNVLLTHDMKAKISDFGLSTRIYIKTHERKGHKQNIVPFRWTAPEVLLNGTPIKEFGDVWSFGVFVWEVFQLGCTIPYGDKSEFEEIIEFLNNGHRLCKPTLCPQYIYDLMLECWSENYLCRPTFLELKNQLIKFAPEKHS